MNSLELLRLAIKNKLYVRREWLLTAFSITKPTDLPPYAGKIVRESWGYSTYDAELNKVKLEWAPVDQPPFTFKDTITVDGTWAPNITEETPTTVGKLIFNMLCIVPAFGSKYPYITGPASVKNIEQDLAKLLVDTPLLDNGEVDLVVTRDPDAIYVDDYIRFVNALQFLSSLSLLTTWAATPKTIVGPTGLKEFKAELMKRYEGKLTDPVELSKFEAELLDFDDKFLQDDPAYGKSMSGKVKNVARKKMFLDIGGEESIGGGVKLHPVVNSLNEGWPTDDDSLVDMFSNIRAGSYSRGVETIKGGVSAKILLRATDGFVVQDTDCGSTLGIRRTYLPTDEELLVGRYIQVSDKPLLVENITAAANLVGKALTVRSPMYCKLTGDNICRVCAGDKLFKFPKGLTIPITEISGIILGASLAAMHSKALTTQELNINKEFS